MIGKLIGYIPKEHPWQTRKAEKRRIEEGFFEQYCQGHGIDIGCGGFMVTCGCIAWDVNQGNAQEMWGVRDGQFDWVHSCHCLEHLSDPFAGLRRWWDLIKPGGYLLLLLPDRDRYEKKEQPPSDRIPSHKTFFVPEEPEGETLPAGVLSVRSILATLPGVRILYIKYVEEYSIESVAVKEA